VLNQGQNFIQYKGVCLPSTCEITAKKAIICVECYEYDHQWIC